MPILVLSSYTQRHYVAAARDAGANLVARKPISPRALYDRITWVAHTDRPFVETETFFGPDRRFKDLDPPDGIYKRESDPPSETETSDGQAPILAATSEAT